MLPKNSSLSQTIYRYLKKYQEDPESRIFAPLAEAYRKAGLLDQAIEIAREGLAIHPSFLAGKVALGRALFDKQEYQQVLELLIPISQDAPDNLVAQRLVAESHLMLGHVAQALDAYKMLLYFSPNDSETAQIVWEMESKAYEKGVLILTSSPQKPARPESRARWMKKIEKLQEFLVKIERKRAISLTHSAE